MKNLQTPLLVFCTWLLWLVVSQYFLCAHFQLTEASPFEGPALYNPYDSIVPENWVKCNFHAHARAWNGFTNGHDHASDIHKKYHSLGYGIHCVSNYHYIDSTNADRESFIPAYEHGYNVSKTHQLVLGDSKVVWLDYLFPQTFHNKQHILKNLYQPETVTILNHPGIREGYTESDLASLSNYDCMEVLNPSAVSTRQWDAALSAGKKVFIVGNDDIHNLTETERLGRMCTFVNIPKNNGKLVLDALKTGRSYGVEIGRDRQPGDIPLLQHCKVTNDTITIKVDKPADLIEVTSQNGRLLHTFGNTDHIKFHLSGKDHYARTTLHYADGTKIFLNPVFFTPSSGYKETTVYENPQDTAVYRLLGLMILGMWFAFVWQMLTGNRGQNLRGSWLPLR